MTETLDEKKRANDLYAREQCLNLAVKVFIDGRIDSGEDEILAVAKKFSDYVINGDIGSKR